MQKDRLSAERKSLKGLIMDLEDEVLANSGVDIFGEVFKLIFTKLYDEMESSNDRVTIEVLLKEVYQKQFQSKQLYKEAERLLLEELGLVNYQPKHFLTLKKTTKKAIVASEKIEC